MIATVQQAITTLLTSYEPEFLRMGFSLFVSFATILLAWQGIRMMLNQDSMGDHFFNFAKCSCSSRLGPLIGSIADRRHRRIFHQPDHGSAHNRAHLGAITVTEFDPLKSCGSALSSRMPGPSCGPRIGSA